ncbi:LysR family transcriptional regulator [Actinomadura barringtoniae]|uniref:LysR family transcriptional regulator n=1 Tax=Actinomadura barringtoniae TaxID=1427535 RepID=A0A939PBS8_9ACTN|nr:LysR family transcriptional regulator [Actinomadura barringtoniae]MBO2449503.1 LysR family transcriptional regulator [Actinomadura barringtoniae]
MQLELRHLRTLCVIADAGSLSRAAAVVGVSQPALTGQLHRIEAALGGQVFRRGRKGVTLTPFGQFVLRRARSIMVTVDELLGGAESESGAKPGAAAAGLRIGGYHTPVLTGLLHRLFEMPGAPITVHTEYSPRLLLDLLVSRRLDVATLVDYPGHELPALPTVGTRVIAVEPVAVALPAGHPLAGLDEIPLSELADEDWLVSPPDGAGWPECFYTACQEAGFVPRVRHMLTEHEMIRSLVAEGRAAAPCQVTLNGGPNVVVRPLTGPTLWLRHVLAWRLGGPLDDRVPELAALAVEAHEAAVADVPGLAERLVRGDTALASS